MDLLIGVGLLCLFIGFGILLVNMPWGSGYDPMDTWRFFTGRGYRSAATITTPKLIPRFKHGILVGGFVLLIGIAIILLTS